MSWTDRIVASPLSLGTATLILLIKQVRYFQLRHGELREKSF